MTSVYYLLQVCTIPRVLWHLVQIHDTKFITHENFQLSGFQKCAKFYTHENFYVYGIAKFL